MEFDVKQQAILKGCFSVNESGEISLRTVADEGTTYTPAVTPRVNRSLEQLLLSAVTVAADGKPAIRLSTISMDFIVAVNDAFTADGVAGNASAGNVITNDTLGGVAVEIADVTLTVLTAATPATVGATVPVLNTSTGVVSVAAGTPAGTYTIVYRIAETAIPTNRATATVTVTVTGA